MSATAVLDAPPLAGYGATAQLWRDAGWDGVLPLPAGQKSPPPEGFTGWIDNDPSGDDIAGWIVAKPNGNVALRMPEDIIGVDIDAYKDDTARARLEAYLGCELPPTIVSTSRLDGTGSGIYLFRVQPLPAADRFVSDPVDAVEIVQRGHRYAVVWPSLHPEGRSYFLVDQASGEVLDGPVDITDERIALLPWTAQVALRTPRAPEEQREPVAWVYVSGTPSVGVRRATEDAVAACRSAKCRHDAACAACLRLVRMGSNGQAGVPHSLATVKVAFVAAVGADRPGGAAQAEVEFDHLVSSAEIKVATTASILPPRGDTDGMALISPTVGIVVGTAALDEAMFLPDSFWEARPALRHIRQAAYSRQRSPDAVFHSVMARIAAMSPHTLKLPASVGTSAPLCLFTVLLARPGVGKSNCAGISGELVPSSVMGLVRLADFNLGSGEGLVESLFEWVTEDDPDGGTKKVKVKRQKIFNAIVYVDEIQTLTAIGGRNGATVLPALRTVWSGGALGAQNASQENKRQVPAGNYTYGLIVGVQDALAGPLLNDADAGTPQRFAWASALCPGLPPVNPEWPGPLKWRPCTPLDLVNHEETIGSFTRHVMKVDDDVVAEIRAADADRQRGIVILTALQAHGELLRLKIAALLALLDDRLNVTKEDWALAGIVKTTSDAVRTHAAAAVAAVDARVETSSTQRKTRQTIAADQGVRRSHVAESPTRSPRRSTPTRTAGPSER